MLTFLIVVCFGKRSNDGTEKLNAIADGVADRMSPLVAPADIYSRWRPGSHGSACGAKPISSIDSGDVRVRCSSRADIAGTRDPTGTSKPATPRLAGKSELLPQHEDRPDEDRRMECGHVISIGRLSR